MLAEFIVEAAFAKLGIESADDLFTKLATAFKAEISSELAKLDELPQQVAGELGGQISGVLQQVTAIPGQVLAQLPAILTQAINNLPFIKLR
jgi:hypothetical protein